ncbi:hypothetical protein C7447_10750 [Tenacibaculum adriaticum]|uniref:AB hydrolase-1 domain-containing protein n=1 Tax=Tenacibaculum adriaticum TaxID=413713 RepID=A0A5S5DLG7_9FLAO|nr:alpha/beta hydrolase [Tenacibaculum adriaticum]TYP96484.1 hypothetical protein C7447_10750 [Tenacibaculum adriaticum]
MKKITFWVLTLIISMQVQAQLTNGNFTTEIDERIKNLDKTPITSNILVDRVFPVASLQIFNQNTQKDTSNVAHFKQAWSELYRASYIKNFATVENFKQQLKNKNYAKNVVPIGIINTEFHQCNFGTTEQNATVDFNPTTGLFANKPNKNPFIKKQTTIIAPLVAKVSGNAITFTTDNLFKLYKHGKRIKTLQLYTNNTSFNLVSNYNLVTTNFSTTYPSTALQTLRFVVTYSDNTTKTTYATIKIIKPITYAQRGLVSNLDSIEAHNDLLFQGYDENQAYRGKNEYRIYYNDNNEIIDKPLYIIDGYDPNDARKIDAEDYIDFDPDKNQSIYQLMSYKDNSNNNVDLVKELNLKGYDVIIVNHPVYKRGSKTIDGGGDYIERNAYTFISLLRHIKSIQQGNEEAVVIGPSMGGLISRYALAYMEKKYAETGEEKWNHNTRLWVSFDSPHQGANIPIGVQKGIQYFAETLGNESAKEFINEELNKPAPKQMLVNHYTNNTSFPVGAPNFRNRFQNSLETLGIPTNLRKIALINGSMSGVLNGTSSSKYLEIDDDLRHFGPIGGIISVFADRFLAKFYHTTNQKSGNSETFVFDGGIRGKFLWWEWWTTRTNYKSKPKTKGSYDIAPGGYFNAQQLLVDETTNPGTDFTWYLLNWTFHDLKSNLIDPTHSFIPTKSSLAYTGSNVLDENIGNENRVCTGETPFDSYFAPQENQEHIFLTQQNVDWLTQEIEGNEQLPSNVVEDDLFSKEIRGPEKLCFVETGSYSYTPKCKNTEIEWSVTPNLQIVENHHDNIKVMFIGPDSGSGVITATVTLFGITKVINKYIRILEIPGSQIPFGFDVKVRDVSGILGLGWYSFFIPSSEYAEGETWEWNIPSAQITQNNSYPDYGSLTFTNFYNMCFTNIKPDFPFTHSAYLIKFLYSAPFIIQFRRHNRCGCGEWITKEFNP